MSRTRRSRLALAGAALLTAIAVPAGTAFAGPTQATRAGAVIDVALGTHTFGALTPAATVVARVGPDGVGWVDGHEGVSYGPLSFEVAADGTVWLLDNVNDRLLSWDPGQPGRPASSVAVPASSVDFALGPNETIYVSTHRPGETMMLNAVGTDGRTQWRALLAEDLFNAQLRMGPNRILYQVTPKSWIPVADASGAPLSVTEQRRQTLPYQPLTGARQLHVTYRSGREIRVVLSDATAKPVRTWRITSKTDIAPPGAALPTTIGTDVILPLDVFRSQPAWQLEQLALRLTAAGAPVWLHLDNAIWGDTPVTEYRVGPDGGFYQMRTSRSIGVTIARYPLTATATTTPSEDVVAPTAPSSPSASATTPAATPPATPAVTPAAPVPASNETTTAWLIWAGAGGLAAVATLAAGYGIWRHRRRATPPPEAPTAETRPMVDIR